MRRRQWRTLKRLNADKSKINAVSREMAQEEFDELTNLLVDVFEDAIERNGVTTTAKFASLPLSEFVASTTRVIERVNAEKERTGAPDRFVFDPTGKGRLGKVLIDEKDRNN